MPSHAHGNSLPGILERKDWMFPVIRCHKNTLHFRIVRNSPEADSIWSIAYFGQPPGLWFKRPDGLAVVQKKRFLSVQVIARSEPELSNCVSRIFRVAFLFRSISSTAGLESISLIR
jgi:hypothetical protein